MSADTRAPKQSRPEPYRFDDGWRVDATCVHCGATVYLDSPDEMRAEDLWGGDVTDEERGTVVKLGKPNQDALGIAVGSACCDLCLADAEQRESRRRAHYARKDRLDVSGLPLALRNLRWDDMDREGGRRNAIVAARAWAESEHGKMLLYGPRGTGKTRLAATAAWDRLGLSALTWMPVTQLVQAGFADRKAAERQRFVEASMGTGPLVLDDLGKEKPGDWARQLIFGAIDARLQAGSPILITSNFDPDELADRLGEAVGSRLQLFRQFELGGRDRRLQEEAA